jgi:hypothetical protein
MRANSRDAELGARFPETPPTPTRNSNAAIFRRSLFICDIFTRTRASAHILDITNVNAIPDVVRGVEETVGSIDDLVIFGSTGYPEALP